jgi:hypothetical protein
MEEERPLWDPVENLSLVLGGGSDSSAFDLLLA